MRLMLLVLLSAASIVSAAPQAANQAPTVDGTVECDNSDPKNPKTGVCCTKYKKPIESIKGKFIIGLLSGCTQATTPAECSAQFGQIYCCADLDSDSGIANKCDPWTGNPTYVPGPEPEGWTDTAENGGWADTAALAFEAASNFVGQVGNVVGPAIQGANDWIQGAGAAGKLLFGSGP